MSVPMMSSLKPSELPSTGCPRGPGGTRPSVVCAMRRTLVLLLSATDDRVLRLEEGHAEDVSDREGDPPRRADVVRREHAHLDQTPDGVDLEPRLVDLPILDTVDTDARHLHDTAGRRDAEVLAVVLHGLRLEPDDHLVAGDDNVFLVHVEAREAIPEAAHEGFRALRPAARLGERR